MYLCRRYYIRRFLCISRSLCPAAPGPRKLLLTIELSCITNLGSQIPPGMGMGEATPNHLPKVPPRILFLPLPAARGSALCVPIVPCRSGLD